MHKGWFGHGSVCTVETLGIVLVCRSETSVGQLDIDCETAKAAHEARHRLNNHIENNAKLDRSAGCDVGVKQNKSAQICMRSSRQGLLRLI